MIMIPPNDKVIRKKCTRACQHSSMRRTCDESYNLNSNIDFILTSASDLISTRGRIMTVVN